MGWVNDLATEDRVQKKRTDFDGINDYHRLWKLMWDDLYDSERKEDEEEVDDWDAERVPMTDDEEDGIHDEAAEADE